jgi:hypothetical protein
MGIFMGNSDESSTLTAPPPAQKLKSTPVDPKRLARRTAPGTSKQAAFTAAENHPTQAEIILDVLRQFPDGLLCEEISDMTGIPTHRVAAHRKKMEEDGLMHLKGPEGMPVTRKTRANEDGMVWYAVPKPKEQG